MVDGEHAGVCTPDGGFEACRPDGTLSSRVGCEGTCVTVAVINGSHVGFCRPECRDGEQECLFGPLYRECQAGRWLRTPSSCEDGAICQPLADGPVPRVSCDSTCTPGTSRCSAARDAIEHCDDSGQFGQGQACASGVCQSKGVQAYCASLCADGALSCAFDGASAGRRCIEPGIWSDEDACADDTSCRASAGLALGCVQCVGPDAPGGNAWGVADRRCVGDELSTCNGDNQWGTATACDTDEICVQVNEGPSSLAYCAAANN
jgi:hypothetical protein